MRPVTLSLALLMGAAAAASAQETFTHELVTMVLPAGWAVQPKPAGAEAEFVASLSAAAQSATVVVTASNRYGNLKEALRLGMGMVQAAVPGAIPDTAVYEMKTASGDNILMQGFAANMQYGGQDVQIAGLLAVTVRGKRGVIAQVYFPPQHAEKVGRDFGQLINSFK
jgi:hypothetical protein